MEVLEPRVTKIISNENYYTYNIQGSVPVAPVRKYVEYYSKRIPSDRKYTAVTATVLGMSQLETLHALADLLAQNADFMKDFEEFNQKANYPKQTRLCK